MHEVQDARREVFRERLGEWPLEDLQTLADVHGQAQRHL